MKIFAVVFAVALTAAICMLAIVGCGVGLRRPSTQLISTESVKGQINEVRPPSASGSELSTLQQVIRVGGDEVAVVENTDGVYRYGNRGVAGCVAASGSDVGASLQPVGRGRFAASARSGTAREAFAGGARATWRAARCPAACGRRSLHASRERHSTYLAGAVRQTVSPQWCVCPASSSGLQLSDAASSTSKGGSAGAGSFYKTSWHISKRSVRIIPTSAWKFGSRTKRASASKAR